jgi:hypothetical protein
VGSNQKEREGKKNGRSEYGKRNFATKYDEKRLTGRSGHRWKNNIKMDLKQIDCQVDLPCSGREPVAESFEHSHEILGPFLEP